MNKLFYLGLLSLLFIGFPQAQAMESWFSYGGAIDFPAVKAHTRTVTITPRGWPADQAKGPAPAQVKVIYLDKSPQVGER